MSSPPYSQSKPRPSDSLMQYGPAPASEYRFRFFSPSVAALNWSPRTFPT